MHDPWVGADRLRSEHGQTATDTLEEGTYDAIVLAVGHREFIEMGAKKIRNLGKPGAVIFDIKGLFGKTESDLRL